MITSIAHDWLADVLAEVRELGLDDLVHYVAAAHRDPMALAVVAAYVAERDHAFDHGLHHQWLVDGPLAPRLGITCSTRAKAQSYVSRLGAEHTIRLGYGNMHMWRAIDVASLREIARRVAA
jgi:hypothetical protein